MTNECDTCGTNEKYCDRCGAWWCPKCEDHIMTGGLGYSDASHRIVKRRPEEKK